jgi:hypothetical protein
MIAAFVTAMGPTGGHSRVVPSQTQIAAGGTGKFTLVFPMTYAGAPHVSFYPAGGGPSFGSAYFGTGKSVIDTIPSDIPDTLNYNLDNTPNSGLVSSGPITDPRQNAKQVNPQGLNTQGLNPQGLSPSFPNPQPVNTGGSGNSK